MGFQDLLKDLDIADEDQLDLFETLDVDGGGTIDLEEFVVGLSRLRGDPRRSDIVSVNLIVRSIQMALNKIEETMAMGRSLKSHRGKSQNGSHQLGCQSQKVQVNSCGSEQLGCQSEKVQVNNCGILTTSLDWDLDTEEELRMGS